MRAIILSFKMDAEIFLKRENPLSTEHSKRERAWRMAYDQYCYASRNGFEKTLGAHLCDNWDSYREGCNVNSPEYNDVEYYKRPAFAELLSLLYKHGVLSKISMFPGLAKASLDWTPADELRNYVVQDSPTVVVKNPKLRKSLKLRFYQIEQALSKNELRVLSIFIFLKTRFENGCYYGSIENRISKKSGLSRTALRKYLTLFRNRGWVVQRDGNLCFGSVKHLYPETEEIGSRGRIKSSINQNRGVKIPIAVKGWCEIFDEISVGLLKSKADRFEYVSESWSDKCISRQRNNKRGRSGHPVTAETFKLLGKENSGFQCGLRRIGSYFNMSVSRVQVLMSRLVRTGLVKRTLNVKYLGNVRRSPWLKYANHSDQLGKQTYINRRGSVYSVQASVYTFIA